MKLVYVIFILLLIPTAFAQQCNGCLYRGDCVEIGTQKIINENTFYCDEDSVLRPVKLFWTGCEKDYECISFYCNGNICDDVEFEKEFEEYSGSFVGRLNNFTRQINEFLLPLMLLIILGIVAAYIFLKGKQSKKKKGKERKEIPYGINLSSGKKHDRLEKDIEESFEDVKKALK